MIYFFLAFFISILIVWLIIHTEHLHYSFTHDDDFTSVQKFHEEPVPRIGGVGLAFGICITLYYYSIKHGNDQHLIFWVIISAIPVFLGGLIEDLTKKVKPVVRLSLAFLSSAIAFFKIDASFARTGLEIIDQSVLEFWPISFLLTLLIIGGVSNAANIIDGFNGLLLGYAMLGFGSMVWISYQCNDEFILFNNIIILGAILGLFLFNFPRGKIFTGDGGAYLIGFLMILNALLLVNRNESISPLLPFVLCVYPMFETLFSMYRRVAIKGKSPFVADDVHLHTLIHRRVVPQLGGIVKKHHNPITSLIVWGISLISIIPTIVWWNNTYLLLVSMLLYCTIYTIIYLRIIRFG